MRNLILAAAFAALLHMQPAQAATTITYSYDTLGRLIVVARAGGGNDQSTAVYDYDRANNRGTQSGTRSKVIVVPVNKYTVIPLPQE